MQSNFYGPPVRRNTQNPISCVHTLAVPPRQSHAAAVKLIEASRARLLAPRCTRRGRSLPPLSAPSPTVPDTAFLHCSGQIESSRVGGAMQVPAGALAIGILASRVARRVLGSHRRHGHCPCLVSSFAVVVVIRWIKKLDGGSRQHP